MSTVQTKNDGKITDYELGKILFRRGVDFDVCTTDTMRSGWLRAENFVAWGVFSESPKQALQFELAQPWNAASAGMYPGATIVPNVNPTGRELGNDKSQTPGFF